MAILEGSVFLHRWLVNRVDHTQQEIFEPMLGTAHSKDYFHRASLKEVHFLREQDLACS